MPHYCFDAKAFVTVHVSAPDEATARAMVEDLIYSLEGAEHLERLQDDGSKLVAEINSASQDGDADLIDINGEDPEVFKAEAAQ